MVYIEPYPKSYVYDLYPDSISVNSNEDVSGKVLFEPLSGIAPRFYQEIFLKGKRKNSNGRKKRWQKINAKPHVVKYSNLLYYEKEISSVVAFGKLIEEP